ncbi:MAG: sulfatase [Planctomycetaceae bacterium]|nr:sulfatase [Planctomycetaceae bacterium]
MITPLGLDLLDRRRFLGDSATMLGSAALAALLADDGLLAQTDQPGAGGNRSPIRPIIHPGQPHAARPSHFPPRVQQVVMIFCSGAISPLDTFEYKPELVRRHGQPLPGKKLITFQGEQGNLTRPLFRFRPRGESGKMVSTLVDHLGELADEMCFVHSLTTRTNTHGPGENAMSTGFTLDGFPSIGAWATYALGSGASDLPAFVAIPDPRGKPQSSVNNWGPGFLPAAFQGTDFNAANPIRNLARPATVSREADKATRGFLARLNRRHLERFPGDTQLAARIASYELAARMQLSVPDVTDLSTESRAMIRLYGADSPNRLKAGFARNCLLARRLIERGVRFVQLFNGSYQTGGEGTSNWDGHKKLKVQYDIHGPILDQPAAGLIRDLKQRGLLDHTLVVFCSEFGRMPTFQKGASGRDHNPDGFTGWFAGAGVKSPLTYGATDPFGHRAVEGVATVHDFHATILHLLGLDHRRLSFYHNGIERRLTNVHGHVIEDILS